MRIEAFDFNFSSFQRVEQRSFTKTSFSKQLEEVMEAGRKKITEEETPIENSGGVKVIDNEEDESIANEIEEMKLKLVMDLVGRLAGKIPESNGEDIDFTNISKEVTPPEESVTLPSFRGSMQQISFQSQALVVGENNTFKKLDIDVNLTETVVDATGLSEIDLSNIVFTDPLMVNFDGEIPNFLQDKFEFDIDLDGEIDKINRPDDRSGFIVYDRNGNGLVDDGNELFGPVSGNGFDELRLLDNNNNNMIDEEDEEYDKLKIWAFDKNGIPDLYGIRNKGINTINLDTFEENVILKSGEEIVGRVRDGSSYTYLDGTAGMVHMVDFKK